MGESKVNISSITCGCKQTHFVILKRIKKSKRFFPKPKAIKIVTAAFKTNDNIKSLSLKILYLCLDQILERNKMSIHWKQYITEHLVLKIMPFLFLHVVE